MATHHSFSALACALTLAAGVASAQDHPPTGVPESAMDKGKMDHMMMKHPEGMHTMPATVDAVDHATGIVEVTSGGMKLTVHFPPASLASVNNGDKITLHMGFTK